MTTWTIDAIAALTAANASPVELGMQSVPSRPGLYAIHADSSGWKELELGPPPDERPLYVGKSESSLAGRDIGTHFGFSADSRGTSITGGSTLRRSLAALLRSSHGFRGVPRNMANPGHFSNYGLTREHDILLSEWMRDRLRVAAWPVPLGCNVKLEAIEQEVFRQLLPPLNLKDVDTSWKFRISAARRVMAEEARGWRGQI